jgi:hypothetical protein
MTYQSKREILSTSSESRKYIIIDKNIFKNKKVRERNRKSERKGKEEEEV